MSAQMVSPVPTFVLNASSTQAPMHCLFRLSFLSARSQSSIFTDPASTSKCDEGDIFKTNTLNQYGFTEPPIDTWPRTHSSEKDELETENPIPHNEERGEDALICLRISATFHRRWSLLMFVVSLATYLVDMGCDAYLIMRYFMQNHLTWALLTLTFVTVPSLITTGFSLVWYYLDQRVGMGPQIGVCGWTWRLLLHAFLMAPIARHADALIYGFRELEAGKISVLKAAQFTHLRLYELADCAMLRLMEAFMESAPQLLLQLYILLTTTNLGTSPHNLTTFLQYASCATSLISLAYSLTAYQIALHQFNTLIIPVSQWRIVLAALIFFVWKVFILSSRLLALSLLAACLSQRSNPLWIFYGFVFLHWFLAFITIIHEKIFSDRLLDITFSAALAVIHCFDVALINMRRRRRYRTVGRMYGLWYTVFMVENVAAATVWLLMVGLNEPLRGLTVVCVVIVNFCFGIAFMIIYYGVAYPKVWSR